MHVFTFNPITGQPLEGSPAGGETLDVYARQVSMLTQMDDTFIRPLLILDKQLKVSFIATCQRVDTQSVHLD